MSCSPSAPARTLRRKGATLSLAAAVAAVLASQSAFAKDQTWNDVNANGIWDTVTAANWIGGAAWSNTTPDSAIFNGFGGFVTLGAPIVAGGLTFDASGYEITDGGIVDNTLTLGGTAPTIKVTNALDSATISAAIAGAKFTKTGDGTLILKGATPYTGETTIGSGTLQLDSATALSSASNITLGISGSVNPTLLINANTMNLGALTVPAGVTGAAISFTQNSGTWSHTINGATLSSPLNVNQSVATSPRWNQITWNSKITGTGGGSGNDTLVFNNTANTQNYFTMAANVNNDFSGNIHVKSGLIAVQSASPGGNFMIPDASMLIVDSGATWRWNTAGMVETIDGLAGAGAIGNQNNATLTINASNSSNAAARIFSGTLGGGLGGNALTLGGSGTQEFSGANITYSSNTNLNNGTLKLTKTTGWASNIVLGTSNSPKLELNSPASTDSWSFAKPITGTNTATTVEKTGPGIVNLTAAQTGFNGSITVTGGKLLLDSNPLPTAMPSIAGMTVWLDAADPDGNNIADTANGAAVSSWVNKASGSPVGNFDLDGANGNAPIYTASSAAFNNQSVITFDDAGKQLATRYNFGNTVSVIYVGRIDATKQRLVAGYPGSNWILGYWNGNMNANYWGSGNLGSTADTNAHIWMSGATSGAYAGYRFDSGGETSIGTGTGTGPNGLMLGGGWTNGTERSDGEIGEFFVFNKQLSTTERQQLEGYLYNKYYGSQAGLVSLNPSSVVTVGSEATFGGYGSAGAVNVGPGGIIEGGKGGIGTLTVGSLTFSGAGTVSATLSGSATPIIVTNALTTGGANSVTVSLANQPANGTYHLLQFGSFGGAIGDFKFASPVRAMSLQLDSLNKYLNVVVNSSNFPIWTGGGSGQWSSNTGLNNWKLSSDSSATDFLALDNTLFDDTASRTDITVGQTDISPGTITFNNSNKAYTLTQANAKDITSGSLVKNGTGKLTISGSFSFPGGATLNGGVVSIDNETALGASARTINGATLEYTGATATWTRNITINAGGGTISVTDPTAALTHSGSISGTGSWKKAGSGALVLSGANTFTSTAVLSQGTLVANNASAMGVNSTLVLGDANTGANPVEFKVDSGITSAVNLGSIATSTFGTSQTVTINGGSALGVNAPGLITTLNLDGNVPLTVKATNTGGHGTAQDINTRIQGSGIPAGTTALILDGTGGAGIALRLSQLDNTSAASNFTGDVLIKGAVITQGRTYLDSDGNNPANQNLNFLNNDITVDAGATWTIVWGGETAGALKGSGNITLNNQKALNNTGLTFGNTNRDGVYSGTISGSFGVVKVGTGTQELSGMNTYTRATTVSAGTLLVSGSIAASSQVTVENGATLLDGGLFMDCIGDLAQITLGGGTGSGPAKLKIDNSNGQLFETVGVLTLAGNSILDIGTGVDGIYLNFGDSSANAWTPGATLSIYNWSSNVDHVSFDFGDTALTSAQLSSIKFYSDAGTKFLGSATILPAGEIVPVAIPEPSALALGVGAFGYLFSRRRRSAV